MRRRVLLIGATGAFGARLARGLAHLPGITLIVTSRTLAKAQALAAQLCAGSVQAIAFAHGPDAETAMHAVRPWLVIDASGPFQGATYDTARAAISCGAHWIDLADDADYILAFPSALDAGARAQGVSAFTGVSSTPALSCAAAAEITAGWRRVDDVAAGIYPAGGGGVGRAVIEAVLSYAGAPVAVCRDGQFDTVVGWGSAERVHVAYLGHRYRSAVATADYALMPRLMGALNVSFFAGLESRIEHMGLVGLAKARARGVINSASHLAPLLHNARTLTKTFCGTSGAMTVDARGVDKNGDAVCAQWGLIAHDGDGPNVPVLAALALTKKMMTQTLAAGASCSAGMLDLAAIEREMAPFAISTWRSPCSDAVHNAVCARPHAALVPPTLLHKGAR